METLTLNGAWQLRQADGEQTTWLPATVPGCVHTDLLAAGEIPDPFPGDNELQVMWVGEADWLYRRTFTVPEGFLARERVLLRCCGLDTLATITLNGQVLGRADNMFRTWEFDVKERLRAGENEIAIRFDSALRFGRERLAERYIHSWSTDTHKLPGGNYVRKAAYHFGWDWGPKLVTCGIWRDIDLLAFDARLADIHLAQDHSPDGQVTLTARVTAENPAAQALTAVCTISFDGREVAQQRAALAGDGATLELPIPQPRLWWPKGLGDQSLYEVQLRLLDGRDAEQHAWHGRIGLRTLQLDRHEDQWGQSFRFRANGVPFFAKGANWIPADSFVTRVSDDHYWRLLADAAEANMNMLRVWGGGIYEQDIFYDYCDRLGICVWQDFMFACATYPTFDAAFMANVQQEAGQTIRRLRHHACLALWCGNNELEQGLVSEAWSSLTMSLADYGKLFDDLLPGLVAAHDPQTAYWPGSPHSPLGNRYDWNNPRCGDAHIWEVWHGKKPFEYYRTCNHRFCSEFGFQSFPEPRTVATYAAPQERNVTSYIMEHHQRSDIGNQTIIHYMLDWFRLPATFENTVWLSQILQGMAMRYAVEHWRRNMPRSMGALYWQLNDCWPVASWSSLDYFGRWKALHYMARHFYAPLIISGVEDLARGAVALHVTSDRREEAPGVARWLLATVGGQTVAEESLPLTIPAQADRLLAELDLRGPMERYGARNLLLWLELLDEAGVALAQNLVTLARPKHLPLHAPGLSLAYRKQYGAVSAVTVTAENPALWVWLEAERADIRVSDNFFHVRPGRPVTVTVSGAAPGTAVRFRARSLFDTYQSG